MATTPETPDAARPPQAGRFPWKLIAAGTVGNVMEWYDFAVYGYFAAVIGRHFFPSDSPTTSLIAAFGVFAAGFLMRPLGGVVFGHVGDRVGRKAALTISVLAMAVPTFLIGLLPGYGSLGVAAPVLLVVLRMVQGLSVGGEYTTSIVFLVESAGPRRGGFAGSWSGFGCVGGILLGSAVGAVVTGSLSGAAIDAWGWRVPFLAGLLVGLAGLYVRKHMPEPPRPEEAAARPPVWQALKSEWRTVLRIAQLNVINGTAFYMMFVFLVTYLETTEGMPAAEALRINTWNMAVLLAVLPLSGWLADRVGPRPLLVAAVGGMLLLAWPLFWLIHHPLPAWAFAGQFGFALLIGLFGGALPVAMVGMTPAAVRCSAISVGYNLCLGLLGGTTPMVAAWLLARTGDPLSPAFYLMAGALVSLAAAVRLPRGVPVSTIS